MEKTILVISDEPDSSWQRALRQALRPRAELHVRSEQEACRQTGDDGHALLIIDAAGIDSDAGVVIASLRATFPRTPIVVATLSPSWERARQAFLAGASDYVAKSLDPEAIQNSFRDVLAAASKPAILLADNEPGFLKSMTRILDREGYHVIAASNPEDAQRILQERPLAAAVLDWRLRDDLDDRDDSGLRVALNISPPGAVPVILLTRYADHRGAREALRPTYGGKGVAFNYVAKSEGADALLVAIREAIFGKKVFLCYAHPDMQRVEALYQDLAAAGFEPWMDRERLVSGKEWRLAIHKTMQESDFCVVCLSESFQSPAPGFRHEELGMALERQDKMPDAIFVIPARLDDIHVTHTRLQRIQYADLYEPDGFRQLVRALREGVMERIA